MKISASDFPLPHIPDKLPIDTIIQKLTSEKDFLRICLNADQALSEFIGYLHNLPNPNILITALTIQEAVESSKIEGTMATIEDVLHNEPASEDIKNDIKEISNYITAIHYAFYEMRDKNIKISKYMICSLHQLLLSENVRGANKTPGAFKTEQNYIPNHKAGNFTPLPPYLTDEYIENLVTYINNADEISTLIAIAVIHAQFEMIHPFKDGNGRIGRLLIPLYLFIKGRIPYPVFYISRFFLENDDEYKESLLGISKCHNVNKDIDGWRNWLVFFFKGIIVESKRHIESAERIIKLYKDMIEEVNKTDEIAIIDAIFNKLRVTPSQIIDETHLPKTSVYRALAHLTDMGYLTRVGSPRKSLYIFTKLIIALDPTM